MRIKKILVPFDFTRCADQALGHAIHIARHNGAELHILFAIVLHNPLDTLNMSWAMNTYSNIKDYSEKEMARIIEEYEADDLVIEQVHIPAVSAKSMILQYASEYNIDLVVMGTHGRKGLNHLLFGSIAEDIVRLGPCPVLTVREQENPRIIKDIERILVPVDFSDHSRLALIYAEEMAASYGARLQLFHIIEGTLYPSYYYITADSSSKLLIDDRALSRLRLERWKEEILGPKTEADIYVLEGKPTTDIVNFAEEKDSDRIVMGTQGLTGLKYFLLGSVSEKAIRAASCPVFTVKSDAKQLIESAACRKRTDDYIATRGKSAAVAAR